MIETYFHFTVKLAICSYVLYRVWLLLFKEKLFRLWDKIPVRPKKNSPEPEMAVVTEKDLSDIIGKTTIVYLDDPELAAKVPAHSEKLEPTDFIGEEPDIKDEDVETDLIPKQLTPEEQLEEQERFESTDDLAPGLDPDFSTGLTYDELSNAVGVLTVATDNEQQIIEAAKTIHSIKDTDLFEFITNQVSNLDNVENLMRDCLDDDGTPLPVRKSKRNKKSVKSFDLGNYV
ncbi:MAG: DUF4122 family protein [Dysgonomonas mossii]|uniref:DUF4122 family protein n=1 Tax=Dysgonomonas mossii TaxID=163665 RepID=UPI003992B4E4